MQQPPPGRPQYRPPGGAPQPPPSAPRPQQPPPGYAQPMASAPMVGPVRKNRGALRFLASSCVFSAWASLIIGVISAIISFGSGLTMQATAARSEGFTSKLMSPSAGGGSGAGLSDLGIGGLGGDSSGGSKPALGGVGDLIGGGIQHFLPPLMYASGGFALVSGIVTFLLFLGLAQVCYILLDMEEQNFQMAQALQVIVARLGAGR